MFLNIFIWIIFILTYMTYSHGKQLDIDFDGDEDIEQEKWLSDEENYDSIDYQSDGYIKTPNLKQTKRCPTIPEVISETACMATPCFSDLDCGTSESHCCDNGCVFTCFSYSAGPTYIDWIREPKKQHLNGLSWLIKGPSMQIELEPCTTTKYKGEDPLLCPTGYICHIESPGDDKKGKPNLGHCIPVKDELPKEIQASKENTNNCFLENYMLVDGAKVKTRNKMCYCKLGYLTCLKE